VLSSFEAIFLWSQNVPEIVVVLWKRGGLITFQPQTDCTALQQETQLLQIQCTLAAEILVHFTK